MDLYTFTLFLISISGSLFIGGVAVYSLVLRSNTRKLIEESKKLTLKMNQIKSEMQGGEPEDFVTGALGSAGIDGIIDALGLPAILKPVAKGFVDNLLKDPEKLKALAEQFGVSVPGSDKTKGGLL